MTTFPGWPYVDVGERRLSRRFTDALVLAAELHAGQERKGARVPFVSHLMAVAAIALEYGAREDEAIGALLHDAIEDAPESVGAGRVREIIGERFGPEVLAIVEGCTDADAKPKPPWRDRKSRYLAHLEHADGSVLLVSAADKLHNVRAILRDHEMVGDRVFERFNKEAGKEGTIGYYRALADLFWLRQSEGAGSFSQLAGAVRDAVAELEQRAGHIGRWPA